MCKAIRTYADRSRPIFLNCNPRAARARPAVIGSTVCPPHTSLMDEVQVRTGLVVLIGAIVIGERRTLHENICNSNARIQWL
jgi:hypothetical protein